MEQLPPARRGTRVQQARLLRLLPRESQCSGVQAHYTCKPPHEVRASAGTWEHGLAPKQERLLARAVTFHDAWSGCRQCGAARACSKRACCASSPERASGVARKRTTRASHPTKCGPELTRGSTALPRRKGGFSLAQCPIMVHGAIPAGATRQARATTARAAPPPQREPAQWCASALHTQATSRSKGSGWHVAARPCKEEGRLLARAVPFYSAWSDCRQRGAPRACSTCACCASSL